MSYYLPGKRCLCSCIVVIAAAAHKGIYKDEVCSTLAICQAESLTVFILQKLTASLHKAVN